jgi:oxaloacetate decarboxylase gamma subunit
MAMGEAGLFEQGVDLMLVGMGTVFTFLTVLVGATSLMSALVARFLPEPDPESVMAPTGSGVDPELVAAIGAAVAAYRQHHKDPH